MSFEGKIALVTGASRVLAVLSLKRSSPVAKVIGTRPAKAARRRSATI